MSMKQTNLILKEETVGATNFLALWGNQKGITFNDYLELKWIKEIDI